MNWEENCHTVNGIGNGTDNEKVRGKMENLKDIM